LTDETREALDVPEGGVRVRRVQDGPAMEGGVRSGDVILMIDNQRVRGPDQFADLVEGLPAKRPVAVLVKREQGPVFLALKLPE
jgi:serine protease Do